MTQEFCPRCGQGRTATFRFCRGCKFDFDGARSATTSARRFGSRRRLIGAGIVGLVLAGSIFQPPSQETAGANAEATPAAPTQVAIAPPTPTAAPPTPEPTATQTAEPTATPDPTPVPTPAPVVATYAEFVTAGVEDRAIFQGVVGSYTWSAVEFPAEQAIVRWDLTSTGANCEVGWAVDPDTGTTLSGTVAVPAGQRVKGSKRYTTAFPAAVVTVESTCGKFLVTMQGDNPAPVTVVGGGGGSCHPSYRPCLPIVGDLNCPDVRAMGKAPVSVVGYDDYGLDRDNDGIGCE